MDVQRGEGVCHDSVPPESPGGAAANSPGREPRGDGATRGATVNPFAPSPGGAAANSPGCQPRGDGATPERWRLVMELFRSPSGAAANSPGCPPRVPEAG